MAEHSFRTVHRILGTQPRIGPIPADQFVPWMMIVILTYTIGQGILGLGLIQTLALAAWGIATWWILTGGQTWRFLVRWRSAPQFCRGYVSYASLLTSPVPSHAKRSSARRKQRRERLRL